jgi:hypothetical protein
MGQRFVTGPKQLVTLTWPTSYSFPTYWPLYAIFVRVTSSPENTLIPEKICPPTFRIRRLRYQMLQWLVQNKDKKSKRTGSCLQIHLCRPKVVLVGQVVLRESCAKIAMEQNNKTNDQTPHISVRKFANQNKIP